MKLKQIGICIIALNFLNPAFAAICPVQQAKAVCEKGEWQVKIPIKSAWTRYSPDIKQGCVHEGEEANYVRWNYAAQSGKHSSIYCSYTLIDPSYDELGDINIESNNPFKRSGDNWKPGDFPGDWECYSGRRNCLFKQ